MIEAVVFDWGGTLTPYHRLDYLGVWRQVAAGLDEGRADELARRLVDADGALWRRARDERRSGHMAEVCEAAGVPLDDVYREAFLEAWAPHTYTDPDAADMLAGLRKRGIAVGLLSNTTWPGEWLDGVLARDGVLDLFDARVYTSDIDHVKPHPDAFHAALEPLGLAASDRVVYVGDRPYDDVAGASGVGLRTVLLPHSDIPDDERWGDPAEPDAEIQRLADLLPVVDDWHAAA